MKRNQILIVVAMLLMMTGAKAQTALSVANLFQKDGTGRMVYNFNNGWRFHLGDAEGAADKDYDDSRWEEVATPHCVKLEPSEASGGRNYQGVAWYRKHFIVPKEAQGKETEIYFEAIMGKQKVYINGTLAKEHEGGYLPVIVHLGDFGVKAGDEVVVAVMADNSNDKSYPPGKPQYQLDFTYHGGIYRDVWLITKSKVHITTAVEEGKTAGGGIFVHFDNISEKSADIFIDTEVENNSDKTATITLDNILNSPAGKQVGRAKNKVSIAAGASQTIRQKITVKRPDLWSPENPSLYSLASQVYGKGNTALDGGITRIGIRSIEFRGKDGFYLNGKRYRQFIGANRHQDFAIIGNAMPNSQHYRDALRLKNAGFNIIRTAHYPQDPSFMDALDELGLFIIVATPGWQYWNKDPEFEKKVQENTRQIIRRDRNHPCVLMWEPILNETRFPKSFSLDALQITRDEYPYPNRPGAAADVHSEGVKDNYDVVYGWPGDDFKADKPEQPILTREFGEYVDDWYAHNAINRSSRGWGERAMMLQALSLAGTTLSMHRTTGQFIGGCLWHPFDHQRGYHPDTYYGGIFDAFRQPKYAYYMYRSQIPSSVTPVVYICHEMMPSSGNDVVVFSNCDSVRLTMYDGEKVITQAVPHSMIIDQPATTHASSAATTKQELSADAFNAPVVFKDAWSFFEGRDHSYTRKSPQMVSIVAEGIVGGKVVCSARQMPSRRSTRLRLYADDMGRQLEADGSDVMVVVAEVTDDSGHVRRLAKEEICFTVEGEGRILGDESIGANPRSVEWGSAPVLIQSTATPGKIRIHAEVKYGGTHAPTPADLVIESVAPRLPMIGSVKRRASVPIGRVTPRTGKTTKNSSDNLSEEEKQKLLREVEQQQADFGVK